MQCLHNEYALSIEAANTHRSELLSVCTDAVGAPPIGTTIASFVIVGPHFIIVSFTSQVTLPDLLTDTEAIAKGYVDECRTLLDKVYATMDITSQEFQDRFTAARYVFILVSLL